MANISHTGIAVLESRWWANTNVSARGLFDLVAEMSCYNPHAYHYEMANSEPAFKEAVPRIAANRKLKYLCIATHGDADCLSMINDQKISRSELRNMLSSIKRKPGSKLQGIYQASCHVGTQKLADFLFEKEVGIRWMAGYSQVVDWIEGSALDLLFFNALVWSEKSTNRQKIEDVAQRVMEAAPGLVKKLGFGIYVRRRATGGAENLCDPTRSRAA